MTRIISLAAVAAVLLGLGLTSPAHAATDNPGRLMLVLDSSGSMKESAGSTTKIAAAKSALNTVIDDLPAEQEVGLRVYGAKVFSAKDKGACTDSQRAVDLGTDNRADLKDAVATYKPYGETPTGYALQQAGKDLGTDGERTIILVSDGESTCSPDPCVAAKELAKDGIQLRIDVVGLDVSGKAREQLRCVAKAGNGTYYDANDAASLVDSLTVTSTRASRPFDLTGKPVKGTADPASAPTLARGQYLDTFGTGDGLWYRVKRSAPNSTVHVGVTHRSTDTGNFGEMAYVGVHAGPDESRCDYESSFPRGNIAYTAASSSKSTVDHECNTAETLWVNVKQMSTRRDFAGEPVEIVVYEEPPLKDPSGADLAPKAPKPSWTTLSPAAAQQDVVPGTSISNAPVVRDGTYALDINPGETQVLAVPLDWGQDLQAQLDGKLTAPHHEGQFDHPWVQVLGPLRAAVDTDDYGVADKPDDWTPQSPFLADETTTYRTGSQSYAVAYRNRNEVEEGLSGSSVAGLRYVQVSFGEKNKAPMAYTLTLKTNGSAADAPSYTKVAGLVAPRADSPLVTGVGAVDTIETKADKTTQKDDDDGGLPLLPIGLGLLGAALLAGAYIVIRKARTTGGRA